jgi:hypothetical protein
MAQEYFPSKSAAKTTEPHSPALTDADEEFLRRLTTEVGESGQEVVIFDGADKVPLPQSPPAVEEKTRGVESKKEEKKKDAKDAKDKKKHRLSAMLTSIRSSVPIPFGKVSRMPITYANGLTFARNKNAPMRDQISKTSPHP